MKNYLVLNDKTAIVTGGRRGLGKAMALGLADAGANVAVIARSDDPGDIEDQIKKMGRKFLYIQADLSIRKERDGIIDRVYEHFGQLDILINNAGIQQRNPLLEYNNNQLDLDISILLTAVFELSRQAAEIMIKQGGGKIINMASISSFQGARQIIGYATAKHGIIGLTKCLANELAPHNINVNAIAPGLFETEMAGHVFKNKEQAEIIKSRIPAANFGQLEDIVGPMLFLASNMSKHVHGHALLVDGGWMGR